MKTLLFNINSTSWFYTLRNGGLLKLEVYYMIMCITAVIATLGLAYDVIVGLEYSSVYQISTIPFVLFIVQYLAYSIFKPKVVGKEIQDKFWKTQLWRFKDPNYDWQKSQYPDWEAREVLLDRMWEAEYNETTDETIAKAPWLQKYRIILLISAPLIIMILASIIS